MKSKKKEESLYNDIDFTLLPKQVQAVNFLNDHETRELVYGGGTRGGKSYLGCAWIIYMCLEYPETKYLIGRARLKILKQTTQATFYKVLREMGLQEKKDYRYRGDVDILVFSNGSEVIFKDLFHYPSDPDYTSLGSLEITGAFLDECGEIPHMAKTIVKTRLSWLLEEYGLMGKILMTCNPAKNWLYFDYYEPWKKGLLPDDKQFLISLVDDNPYISQDYIDNLENLGDQKQTNRLRFGKWEDDSDLAMFKYDVISDAFTNEYIPLGLFYITCDAARFGADRLVIGIWCGLNLIEVFYQEKSGIDEIVAILRAKAIQYKVPRSRIIVDEDGVGGGVIDFYKGIVGFRGGSSPLDDENYANLRNQCYFKLSDCMELREISFAKVKQPAVREFIIADLTVIDRIDQSEGRLKIIGKDEIKKRLTRSPDFGDMIMMRMYFWKKTPVGVAKKELIVIENDDSLGDDY